MKKIILLIICLLFIYGCSNKVEKFYINDDYYLKYEFIDSTSSTIEELGDSSYIVYTYNNYCTMKIPCENIFKAVAEKYNLTFYSIPYAEMKNTFLHDTVSYAPSIILVKNGKVVSFLDAEKDEDYNRYQDETEFTNWLNTYIYLEK